MWQLVKSCRQARGTFQMSDMVSVVKARTMPRVSCSWMVASPKQKDPAISPSSGSVLLLMSAWLLPFKRLSCSCLTCVVCESKHRMHPHNISIHQLQPCTIYSSPSLTTHAKRRKCCPDIWDRKALPLGWLHPHGRASQNVETCSQLALNETTLRTVQMYLHLKAVGQICGHVNTIVDRLPITGQAMALG